MTPTEFALFKYQHADAAVRSPARRWFTGISFGLALLLIVSRIIEPPFSLLTLLVPLLAWATASRQLLLGPRYLLCGQTIVYYANVKRLTLTRGSGTLRVQSSNGQNFVLERDKFPTNARKADKIKKNKAVKFDKVADKLIEKVRKAAPGASLTGV
jgi:hypothetical protein